MSNTSCIIIALDLRQAIKFIHQPTEEREYLHDVKIHRILDIGLQIFKSRQQSEIRNSGSCCVGYPHVIPVIGHQQGFKVPQMTDDRIRDDVFVDVFHDWVVYIGELTESKPLLKCRIDIEQELE